MAQIESVVVGDFDFIFPEIEDFTNISINPSSTSDKETISDYLHWHIEHKDDYDESLKAGEASFITLKRFLIKRVNSLQSARIISSSDIFSPITEFMHIIEIFKPYRSVMGLPKRHLFYGSKFKRRMAVFMSLFRMLSLKILRKLIPKMGYVEVPKSRYESGKSLICQVFSDRNGEG